MTIAEEVITKLSALTDHQQQKVLEFVQTLTANAKPQLVDGYGLCADLRTDLPLSEFEQNRREMWGDAADKEL
jgi:hypothetical protein